MQSVWSRLGFLRAIAASPRVIAAEARQVQPVSEVDMARRWSNARRRDPELVADLIRLGGILSAQPMQDGEIYPLDPHRLAYEAGRRDMAVQLAALMSLTITELNALMEDDDA